MNFQIELTSFCDLTCGYCPNKDMQRPRAFMSDEVWYRILHDYVRPYKDAPREVEGRWGPCAPTFIGHKDGEPLLNVRLTSRLSDLACVVPDMGIDIYSHGLLLPRYAARGKDFIDFLGGLPNRVRFLMSYHPYNHDGTANDYEETVRYLSKKLLSPPRNIEFIAVCHRSRYVTSAMQEAWKTIWVGLPITIHCNVQLNPWTGRIQEEGTYRFDGCPYADFSHWFFGVTGNVIACCLDLEEEIVLGNVMTDAPEVLYQRTRDFYAEQRKLRAERRQVNHDVCADCFGQEKPSQTGPFPTELIPLGTRIT